jgi:hypothetical protein
LFELARDCREPQSPDGAGTPKVLL